MTSIDYDALSLNELRKYVLTHREDNQALHTYIDRSKSEGRMITINLKDNHCEEKNRPYYL